MSDIVAMILIGGWLLILFALVAIIASGLGKARAYRKDQEKR